MGEYLRTVATKRRHKGQEPKMQNASSPTFHAGHGPTEDGSAVVPHLARRPALAPTSPTPLHIAAMTRAGRIWRLYTNPAASAGEKAAALEYFVELAARCGMTPVAFGEACGLTKPRVRVKAGSRPAVASY
jgi:hypothetical protein